MWGGHLFIAGAAGNQHAGRGEREGRREATGCNESLQSHSPILELGRGRRTRQPIRLFMPLTGTAGPDRQGGELRLCSKFEQAAGPKLRITLAMTASPPGPDM